MAYFELLNIYSFLLLKERVAASNICIQILITTPNYTTTLMNSGSLLTISLLHFSDYLVKYPKLIMILFVFYIHEYI